MGEMYGRSIAFFHLIGVRWEMRWNEDFSDVENGSNLIIDSK
jgi:hypothetical protein